jgi:hypothetical protein
MRSLRSHGFITSRVETFGLRTLCGRLGQSWHHPRTPSRSARGYRRSTGSTAGATPTPTRSRAREDELRASSHRCTDRVLTIQVTPHLADNHVLGLIGAASPDFTVEERAGRGGRTVNPLAGVGQEFAVDAPRLRDRDGIEGQNVGRVLHVRAHTTSCRGRTGPCFAVCSARKQMLVRRSPGARFTSRLCADKENLTGESDP